MKTEGDGTGAATAYLSPGDVAVVDFVFVFIFVGFIDENESEMGFVFLFRWSIVDLRF